MKTNNRQSEASDITEKQRVGVILLNTTVVTPKIPVVPDTDLSGLIDIDSGVTPLEVTPPITPPVEPPAKTPAEIEAEASKAKEVEIAKKYGGVSLNDKGDAIDASGAVVKTAEDILKDSAPKAVTIDEVTYQLNENGDAITSDGKVFKTKAELDALENPEIPFIEELVQKTGITPLGEDGKPKQYVDNIEGVMELVNDIAEIKVNDLYNKRWEANPKAKAYYEHTLSGGDDASFFNVVKDDFKSVVIDEKNPDQMKIILSKLLAKKQFTPEKASKYIKRIEDANELVPEAKEALIELQSMQVKDEEVFNKGIEERNKLRIKEVTDHWEGVKAIVTKGTVNGFIIPETDRTKFFEWMAFATDDKGNSARDQALMKESLEMQLLLDYYRFRGYDVKALVRDTMNQEKVKSLKERILRSKTPNATRNNNLPIGGGVIDRIIPDVSIEDVIDK